MGIIEISIPQEDQKKISDVINAFDGMNISCGTKKHEEDCCHYGEGFMVNYTLLIPMKISIEKPDVQTLNELIDQIILYMMSADHIIAVTNINGEKILFQSPMSEHNTRDIKKLFNDFLEI